MADTQLQTEPVENFFRGNLRQHCPELSKAGLDFICLPFNQVGQEVTVEGVGKVEAGRKLHADGAQTVRSEGVEPIVEAAATSRGEMKLATGREFFLFLNCASDIPLLFEALEDVVSLAQADAPDLAQIGDEPLVQFVPVGGLLSQETQQRVFG